MNARPLSIMTQHGTTGELYGAVHMARAYNGYSGVALCGYSNSERTTFASVARVVTCKVCLRVQAAAVRNAARH